MRPAIEHVHDMVRDEEVFFVWCPECGEPVTVRIRGEEIAQGRASEWIDLMALGDLGALIGRRACRLLWPRAYAACAPCQLAAGWDAYPRDF
jgi:hypothetical protein